MEKYIPLIALAVSFILSAIMGKIFIPILKKLHFGQQILTEEGPSWHASKQGTPTMGGFIFIIITVVTYLALGFPYYSKGLVYSGSALLPTGVMSGLIMALLCAILGFIDDFVKVAKKRNLGLTEVQKLILQVLISAAYIVFLAVKTGARTSVTIPFISYELKLGWLYYVFALVAMVGFTNAVNLTDGLDGLCTSVTLPVMLFYAVASLWSVGKQPHPEASLLACALCGSLFGFLLYNKHKAKVFMGDTGSMFLGGMVVFFAFELDMPLILFIVGIIYFIEAFSVLIQRIYFKITKGKRLFKMTPIHHSFEISGYSENRIVLLFTSITVIACAIGLLWVLL